MEDTSRGYGSPTTISWTSRCCYDRLNPSNIGGLGCQLVQRSEDRMTLDFFGDQIVWVLPILAMSVRASHRRASALPFGNETPSTHLIPCSSARSSLVSRCGSSVFVRRRGAPDIRLARSIEQRHRVQ